MTLEDAASAVDRWHALEFTRVKKQSPDIVLDQTDRYCTLPDKILLVSNLQTSLANSIPNSHDVNCTTR